MVSFLTGRKEASDWLNIFCNLQVKLRKEASLKPISAQKQTFLFWGEKKQTRRKINCTSSRMHLNFPTDISKDNRYYFRGCFKKGANVLNFPFRVIVACLNLCSWRMYPLFAFIYYHHCRSKISFVGPAVVITIAIIVNANTNSTYIRHCFNSAGWHTAKYSLDTKVAVFTFLNIKVIFLFFESQHALENKAVLKGC